MTSQLTDEIRLLGADLPMDATIRPACPVCQRKAFTITRLAGKLAYRCHSVNCQLSGYVEDGGWTTRAPAPAASSTYEGQLYSLFPVDERYFFGRFGLKPEILKNVRITEFEEYAFPVIGPIGQHRGWTIRQPRWGHCAGSIWTPPRDGRDKEPKSREFIERNEIALSWYFPTDFHRTTTVPVRPLIVVEDQVSAMCVAQGGLPSVALLGTSLNQTQVAEIAAQRRRVILALDADATTTAMRIGRKWGMCFDRFRVAILEEDLKDTHIVRKSIQQILGV